MNKIIIDVRMINASGIGVYLKNILPEVIKNFNVILLGNREELHNFSWVNSVEIIDFTAQIYSLKEQFLFPIIVPKADLFWCPHFNTPILPIKVKKRLTTIYDVNHLANKRKSSFLKWLYAFILYKNAVIQSNQIITISQFSKKELIKFTKVKVKKINIILCGVNLNIFRNKNIKTSNIIPEKYILFVGNVKPHKNLITLLKAYSSLDEDIKKKYRLVILGKRDGFITPDKEIINFITEKKLTDRIFFTGYLEDEEVPAVYQKATLFVFPSLYEGFGLPLLEAMASNIPIISSDSSSLPEVGGNAVIYYKALDSVDLKIKIKALLLDKKLRLEYIERGKLQCEDFTWDKASNKHVSLIKRILNN